MPASIDLTGQRFGHLLVLERDTSKPPGNGRYWLCRCDCGAVTSVASGALRRQATHTCGCRMGHRKPADRPCSKCGRRPPGVSFGTNWRGSRTAKCRQCDAARSRDYVARNKDKVKASRKNREKWSAIKVKYGLTKGQVLAMWNAQDKKCAICKVDLPDPPTFIPGVRSVHVDHCHTSRTVRSLLCHNCNVGLGYFRDDPELLLAAVDYLRQHAKGLEDARAIQD
jgi:hypothetical protein